MTNLSAKVLGTHNGIHLIEKEDGTQMYYSTKSNTCAMNVKGLAKMLNCHPQTALNKLVNLGLGKKAEMYTQYGVKLVNLVHETEIPKLLNGLLESRCKQSTKDRVREVQSSYVQAGFRLQVLLEVAPEVVAMEAINHITDEETLEAVKDHSELHGQYLRSEFALNYEAEENHLKAGLIKGKNNVALNLPWKGGRSKMSSKQKSAMATTQLYQADGLNKTRKSGRDYTEAEKYEVCDKVRDVISKLDNILDDIV